MCPCHSNIHRPTNVSVEIIVKHMQEPNVHLQFLLNQFRWLNSKVLTDIQNTCHHFQTIACVHAGKKQSIGILFWLWFPHQPIPCLGLLVDHSNTSRSTAVAISSPISAYPPGSFQCLNPYFSFTTSTCCCLFTTKAPTPTLLVAKGGKAVLFGDSCLTRTRSLLVLSTWWKQNPLWSMNPEKSDNIHFILVQQLARSCFCREAN